MYSFRLIQLYTFLLKTYTKMTDFIGLEYLDFSLDILRRLPSKKVNYKEYSEVLLQKYRNTNEETNAVINGIEIARGLAGLGIVSDGKTKKEILRLLNYACFRNAKSKSLEECLGNILLIFDAKNQNSNNKQAIRMFFEQRDVTSFDKEIIKKLDENFLEKLLPVGNNNNNVKHVLHECNFVCDPSGMVTKLKIDSEICNATEKTIKKVIRADLAPDWRARFLLTVASDENFQLKNVIPPESVIGYFYDSFQKQNKSWCTFVKIRIFARISETFDCSVYEILTTNENENLIIILPKTEKLSNQFLSKLTAEKIVNYIKNCSGDFVEKEAIIPMLSIPGSFGLRSILDKKISFFSNLFKSKDPFAMSRIFCPFKAEFTKIIGKKLEACLVFPLYEFYCKFRCYMKFENAGEIQNSPTPTPPLSPGPNIPQNQEVPPVQPPIVVPLTPRNAVVDITTLAHPNGVIDSGKILLIHSNTHPSNVALVGRLTLHPTAVAPGQIPNNNSHVDSTQRSQSRRSIPPPPRTLNPTPEQSPRPVPQQQQPEQQRPSLRRADGTPLTPTPVAAAAPSPSPVRPINRNNVGTVRALPNMPQPQKSELDDSIYNPPIFVPLATFEHSITIEDEMSGSFKHNSSKHPRDKNVFGDDDPQFHLNADITVTQPFLFMIVSKSIINNTELRIPKFIGRFTNVEETFDESWAK